MRPESAETVYCEPGENVSEAAARRWGTGVVVRTSNIPLDLNDPAADPGRFLGFVSVRWSGTPHFPVYEPETLPEFFSVRVYRESTPDGDSLPFSAEFGFPHAPKGCVGSFSTDPRGVEKAAARMSEVRTAPVTLYRETWTYPRGADIRTAEPVARRSEFVAAYLNGEKVSR